MIVCTGDETGLVKLHSNLRKEVQTYGEQSRQKGVAALHSSSSSRQVSVLRKNGMLERYSMDGKSLEMELINETFSSVMSPLGLVHLNYNSRSLVYNEEGSLATISEDNAVESFKISGPLSVITALNDGFAAGGKENDVKIFDAETRECVWAARNVPHDNLKLRVPVYVKDISFINHENYVASGGCFVTGTAYKQMRLYDTRVSSQPCSSTEIGDYCLTKVKVSSEGNSVFLGDTSGELFCYDLRTLKRIATLSSAAGSIRGLTLSESGKLLTCS